MARVVNTEKAEFGQLPYFPRSCAITGRDHGEFVDFQVVVDHPQGIRLYICREVIEEVAREEFGMVSEGKADQLEEWHAYEKERADELAEENENLKETVKNLRHLDAEERKELSHAV